MPTEKRFSEPSLVIEMRYNKTEPKTDRHCRYSLTPVSLRGEEEKEDVFSRRFIS